LKTLILSVILLSSAVEAQRLIPASARVQVSDENGSPVRSVAVSGCFLDDSKSGASDNFDGITDSKGEFFAKGKTMLGVYAKVVSDGYYPTKHHQWLKAIRRPDGQGLMRPSRWDITVPVLLKRIKKQIPMYMKEVEYLAVKKQTGASVGHLVTNSVAGYDLIRGDVIPPYGNGLVSDLEFRWQLKLIPEDRVDVSINSSALFEIRMANGVDGVCKGKPDGAENGETGSALISDYEAPEGGYTNALSIYRNIRNAKVETNDDQHYLYYFRIRTQTNETGQVTNAFYGKIYGQLNGNFTYYLNPMPNDRNVEHAPKKNLFKSR